MRSSTDHGPEPYAPDHQRPEADELRPPREPHELHEPPPTLATLLPGASARIAGIASPSLRTLLDRLGVRTGAVVRCQSVTSALVLLGVGSHVVAVPRAWGGAVYVTPLGARDDGARQPGHGGPETTLSRDERTFAGGSHLLLG
ncbi:MAG: FeoA domain-containing protein [Gemmatimonadaceae bacterium]